MNLSNALGRVRQHIPALVVALILGLLLGGGAVAAVAIPNNSIGWKKLSRGVQKRIAGSSLPPTMVLGPTGEKGEKGDPGPEGGAGVSAPRCEIVKGDCVMYSVDFWRLQAELAEFEVSTGVYPEPPLCMKAAQEAPEDEPVFCTAVESYLYPDGSFGEDPWTLSADAKGWQLSEP